MSAEGGAAPLGDAPATGEDGEIVGGPRNPQQVAAQKRLQQTQAQVDDVVDIMKTNVEKVLERDQKLSELDDRADALQQGAAQFEQQAGALKNKMWWKNMKMMIIMGVIGLIVIIIVFGPYLPHGSSNQQAAVANNPYQQNMVNAGGVPPAGGVAPAGGVPPAGVVPQSTGGATSAGGGGDGQSQFVNNAHQSLQSRWA